MDLFIFLYFMVKITSILFSIVFLIQSINIHFEDIVKITELIDYANMHKERYGDSFGVFYLNIMVI